MKNSITPIPRTPRLDKRLQSARRTARWRERHPEHVDTRIVDRILLEAILAVITDGRTVPAAVSSRLMPAVIDAAEIGLAEKGYRGADVTVALGQRIRKHLSGRTVGRAISNRELLSRPITRVPE